jgi:hypothetical protein
MRKIRSKSGEMCFKRVVIKVFAPGNRKSKTILQCAPEGKVFTSEGIDQLLEHISAQVERAYPTEEYRLAPVGSAQFNFVHIGPRSVELDLELSQPAEAATINA